MIEIILDASQLELIEPCPRKWFYAHILNLVPLRQNRAFDIGSYYHELLAYYYGLWPTIKGPTERFKLVIELAAAEDLAHRFGITKADEKLFHRKRLVTYLNTHIDEDATLVPIAVEQGFSTLLYEDEDRRYILEGKIDMIGNGHPYGLFVMDHKTQSRKDDRWEFNHQVCNYMSFTNADYFIYNYIGLQDKLPPQGIRRAIYKPPEGMLLQWRKEVFNTFDAIHDMMVEVGACTKYEQLAIEDCSHAFPRRRSACDSSKYGLCQYHKLCSIPEHSRFDNAVLSAYKVKDEKWRAWT